LPPEYRRLIAASPRFEDDKDFLPLQAGDAQSWYLRRLFAERIDGEPFHNHLEKHIFTDLDQINSLISVWIRAKCEYFVGERSDETAILQFEDIHSLLDQLDFN
jgi:hypothetical protein